MTISEAIIQWLQGFAPVQYGKMEQIDTEQQSPKVDSYSLVREPVQNVKAYLSGRKVYTDHYTFHACLASQTEADRVDNNGFGETLEAWVRQQNAAENFPKLEKASVQEVGVTTPFCVGKTQSNNYIYQMTIAIKYEEESKKE